MLRTIFLHTAMNTASLLEKHIWGTMPEKLPDEVSVPLPARIRLSHAYFQNLANANDIDLLHVKGYAFGTEVYAPNRNSTDVDLLVRPAHVARFLYLLKKDGWRSLTTFESGSIFEHAATLYHPSWGLTDVHRYFPGINFYDQAGAFEKLWEKRRIKQIAHFDCYVPQLVDCRNIVVVHGARSSGHGLHSDVMHLQRTLTDAQWQEMRERIREFNSEIAFDAALGDIEKHRGNRQYLFWKSAAEPTPLPLQWLGRLQRAEGLKQKLHVLTNIAEINNDHLAMTLGHEPTHQEKRHLFYERFERILRWKNK